jgi:Ca-activated chloride channel homolog
MTQAKAAGRQLLASLDEGDRFRVIAFSSDVRPFAAGWSTATPERLRAAARWLEALDADGSTNISGALEEALDVPAARGRLPLVLFLTDGEPTVGERNPDRIAQRAAELRDQTRVFTFGVGTDVNAALLEQLALEGRGTAHFVRPEESVERAVSVVASRLTNPVLTNVRVTADGVRLLQPQPQGALDLFAGQDLVVLARYRGAGEATVQVEGTSAQGPVRWTTRATFPERARDHAYVARLWATQRVGWLSAERRRHGPSAELDGEIRALGLRYGIPTELSSYLVLEPGMVAGRAANVMPQRLETSASVARSGNMDSSAPAPAPAPVVRQTTASGTAFDAAKVAAEQRAAVTLADVGVGAAGGAATRAVAGRSSAWRAGCGRTRRAPIRCPWCGCAPSPTATSSCSSCCRSCARRSRSASACACAAAPWWSRSRRTRRSGWTRGRASGCGRTGRERGTGDVERRTWNVGRTAWNVA